MKDLARPKSFLDHFPTPAYLSISNAGVSIDDEAVRLVELSRPLFGKQLKVKKFEEVALPEGVIRSGLVGNKEKLIRALKTLTAERSHALFVRATLPEEKAYLFHARIPKGPWSGLRDAVAFIIEQNVPLALSEAIFDFDVVGDVPDASELNVIVSVLPKQVVEAYTQALESAGMIPVSFDIESQAIARAILSSSEDQAQLIINIGKSKTGFYVVEDNVVQFSTTLGFGSTEAPHLSDLKTELRKIFAFWAAKNQKPGLPARKIEKVVLCGPGSLDNKFVTELMSECEVEYSWVDPLANISHSASGELKKFKQKALEYVPAIGLALPRASHAYV